MRNAKDVVNKKSNISTISDWSERGRTCPFGRGETKGMKELDRINLNLKGH